MSIWDAAPAPMPDLSSALPIWPMYGYGPSHHHRSPRLGPAVPRLKWIFKTHGTTQYSTPAIGADGTVYLGSDDQSVYAIDGASGTKRWSFATGEKVRASPAIGSDGTVYVRSTDQNVYALDGATGGMKWSTRTGAVFDAGSFTSSPTIGPDGTIYVGSEDGSTSRWIR